MLAPQYTAFLVKETFFDKREVSQCRDAFLKTCTHCTQAEVGGLAGWTDIAGRFAEVGRACEIRV